MKSGVAGAAYLLLAIGVLSGCSSPGAGGMTEERESWGSEQLQALAEKERAAGNLMQADVLADGAVTFSEYKEAFSQYSKCLEDAGITVSAPVVSPVSNNRYEFTMDTGALEQSVAVELADTCDARLWTSVSQGYTFTTPSVMDVPVRDASVACLRGEGLEPTGEETKVEEFAELPGADPEAVSTCVMDAVAGLYPELTAISVTF